jgi:hypothetical protein
MQNWQINQYSKESSIFSSNSGAEWRQKASAAIDFIKAQETLRQKAYI